MKVRSTLRIAYILVAFTTIFVPSAARAQDREETIKLNGYKRACLVHLPAGYTTRKRYPVVVVLHGLASDAAVVARLTHFDETADKFGLIVVYPNSREGRWTTPEDNNARTFGGIGGRRRGFGFPGEDVGRADRGAGGPPANDIPFFNNLLDQIESEYSVDTARIYVTGYSDGGFMTFRLGCEMAARFASIATVGATLPQSLGEKCSDWAWRDVSLLMINGTSDPIVDYLGRPSYTVRYPLLTARDSAKVWAKMDSCGTKPERTTLPRRSDGGMETHIDTYADCGEGSGVILYSVVKGGHTWPGGNQYLPERVVGKTSMDFDASEVIWQFFAAHPMPAAKQ